MVMFISTRYSLIPLLGFLIVTLLGSKLGVNIAGEDGLKFETEKWSTRKQNRIFRWVDR